MMDEAKQFFEYDKQRRAEHKEKQKQQLVNLLNQYFNIGDSYAYNLTRIKDAFTVGTMTFDDFKEFTEETTTDIAEFLIDNGV